MIYSPGESFVFDLDVRNMITLQIKLKALVIFDLEETFKLWCNRQDSVFFNSWKFGDNSGLSAAFVLWLYSAQIVSFELMGIRIRGKI